MSRRLPIYLLLDCSESMYGDPLDRVEVGVFTMLSSLQRNPHALETAYISFISFDAKARLLSPLTELIQVKPPSLSIRPGTSLGAALDILAKCLNEDLVKTTSSAKGDYRPLVFILSDGRPTDDWRRPLAKVKAITPKVANIITIGCGEDADYETLAAVGDECYSVKDFSTETIGKLFVWLTASIQTKSVSPDEVVSLAKVPPDNSIVLIDKINPPKTVRGKDKLYFHATCSQAHKSYMLVYEYMDVGGDVSGYVCKDSVRLPDDFFSDGKMEAPPINVGQLLNLLPCPYCGRDDIAKCGFCKHLFCCRDDDDQEDGTSVCPVCETTLRIGSSSDGFTIEGSSG